MIFLISNMKKITIIFITSLLFFKSSFSQIWQKPKISFGFAFRPIPLLKQLEKETTIFGIRSEFMEDNRTRIFIDIEEKLPGKNKLYLSFSNYISLEKILLFSKQNSPTTGVNVKRYKRDYFLNLTNVFKAKKNRPKVILGLGAGIMNCGTKYTFTEEVFGYTYPTYYSERVFATSYIAGFQWESIKATLNLRSFGSQNLQIPKLWLEGKFAYMIHSIKKKK